MAALNAAAADFSAPDCEGRVHRLGDYRGRIALLCFWSAKCAWSKYADGVLEHWPEELRSAAAVVRLACNADETCEEFRVRAIAAPAGILLVDSGQRIADLYNAQATPHFFLVDREGVLRYRGSLDDATFRRRIPTRNFLADALRAVLRGEPPVPAETPAYGCAIVRWKE